MFLLSILANGADPMRSATPLQKPVTMGDMTMQVKSYLSFEGRCEEALDFYKKALGAEVKVMMRFSENPDFANGAASDGCVGPEMGVGAENKVLHSEIQIGETVVMATDGMNSGQANFAGTSQALLVKSAAEADRYFNALAEGGQVMMPLAKTFFSEKFGMTTDRFGVPWMIVVDQA
jgi:PhnB protein